ncbi:MAG: energy-coupled thiamine transporter ThiT [Clostridia bacterium]|nr:energy-coupled thiamine transporter ThiT [Clostridia bacterium]
MKNKKVRALVESAIMIAVATVLSMIKIIDLPYGGSVTVASMFPIAIISYRYGIKWGLASGVVYGALQQLLGLSTLSYVTTWQSVVAIILLDYVIAFAVAGLGGAFRNVASNQPIAFALGALLVCILRYLCHVISGATVWAGISIPTKAALIYSFIYNATYMIPEAIIMVIVAVYIGSIMNFKANIPTRIINNKYNATASMFTMLAGLPITAALITDVALVFSKLQNAETGEFTLEHIAEANWTLVGIVSVGATVIATVLLLIGVSKRKNA